MLFFKYFGILILGFNLYIYFLQIMRENDIEYEDITNIMTEYIEKIDYKIFEKNIIFTSGIALILITIC